MADISIIKKKKWRKSMEKNDFEYLHSKFLAYCRRERACAKGYSDMYACNNMPQILDVMRRYMSEITHGIFYHNCCKFLDEVYPQYRDEFQRYGFAYNEAPESISGWCIVCDAEVTVSHMQIAYGFGKSVITAKDNSFAYARGESIVYYYGSAQGSVEDHCRCEIRDNADVVVSGNATAECWNRPYVSLTDNAFLEAHGWRHINAGGTSNITAWNEQRIRLRDFAKVTLNTKLKPKN